MVVYKDFNSIKKDEDTVLTIGTFDGLHIGHKQIVQTVVSKARNLNCRSLLITFEPHPRTVLLNGNANPTRSDSKHTDVKVELLTSYEDKVNLIKELGVDNLLVIEFTREFAEISSEDFFVNYIYEKIGVREIILGHDHKFGKNRSGDNNLLHSLGTKYNFSVNTLSPVSVDGEVVSSTKIRHLLKEGNINKANRFLDREYSLKGVVVKGDMRGRRIGFPTANIKFNHTELLVPLKGVYSVRVIVDKEEYTGVMNIGTRPSFVSGEEVIKEVHILDFNGDIYGKSLEIKFADRIRDEKKFNSAEELKAQIAKDIEYTRSLLNN